MRAEEEERNTGLVVEILGIVAQGQEMVRPLGSMGRVAWDCFSYRFWSNDSASVVKSCFLRGPQW